MKNKFLFKKNHSTNKKGQSIVEFVLIIPILLLLAFGIVDIGRMVYHNALLNYSTKEAVRSLAVGNTLTFVTNNVQNTTKSITGDVTTSISTGTDDQGNSCTVITFTPASGQSMNAYITPPYTNTLKVGDSIRFSLIYRVDFITPISNILGDYKTVKTIFYARCEKPPA